MKLAIADASDSALDSAAFLETASLTSPGSNLVVELSGRKKQKPVGPSVPPKGKIKNAQRKLLSVKVTCLNEACNVTLSGNAKAGGEKVKLQQQQISLQGGELRKLRLPATSRNDLAALKAALKDGAKGKAKVKATATTCSAGQPVGDNLSRQAQRLSPGCRPARARFESPSGILRGPFVGPPQRLGSPRTRGKERDGRAMVARRDCDGGL